MFIRKLPQFVIFLCLAFSKNVLASPLVDKVHALKQLSVPYGVTNLSVDDKEIMIIRGILATETAWSGDGFSVFVRDGKRWQFAQTTDGTTRETTLWSVPHTGEDVVTSIRFLVPKKAMTALYILKAHRNYQESPLDRVPVEFTLYDLYYDQDFGIYYLRSLGSETSSKLYCNAETAMLKEFDIPLLESNIMSPCP